MIFKINYTNNLEDKTLIYREDEYSFDMSPWNHVIDFELVLNKLTMTVVADKVTQLSGFCGLADCMNSNICVPEYSKGKLKIEHSLKNGFAYGIYNEDQPVYLNTKSGWVCIGNPLKLGNAVEFIQNCVAVISDDGEFLSLWLKPKAMPEFGKK